jgi:WD40 repeat protein
VHLADVSINDQNPTEGSLHKSRWFTRGWTLQELIAPQSVEFFSFECKLLGNKESLEQQICEITGIQVSALQGRPLHQFSVKERLSWAANRGTKKTKTKLILCLVFSESSCHLYTAKGRKMRCVDSEWRLTRLLVTRICLVYLLRLDLTFANSYEVPGPLQRVQKLQGHTDSIGSVTFSPDNQRLASGSQDGIILIWKADRQGQLQQLRKLQGSRGHNRLAFSPDWLASALGESVLIWEANTQGKLQQVQELPGPSFAASISFSQDGRRLACRGTGIILIWEVNRHGELQRVQKLQDPDFATSIAFSPDGR